VPFLVAIVEDESNDCIVRHEAVEALVNVDPNANHDLLVKYS
jgi:hypothetical protein